MSHVVADLCHDYQHNYRNYAEIVVWYYSDRVSHLVKVRTMLLNRHEGGYHRVVIEKKFLRALSVLEEIRDRELALLK